MNGNLLFADQDESIVIIGKKPITAKTANSPTFRSATTHPGATGIKEIKAAAVPTNNSGAIQKIGLSAFAGMIISFDISFSPSPISCRIPSIHTFQNMIPRSFKKLRGRLESVHRTGLEIVKQGVLLAFVERQELLAELSPSVTIDRPQPLTIQRAESRVIAGQSVIDIIHRANF